MWLVLVYASYNIPCATLEIAIFEAFWLIVVCYDLYLSRERLGDWPELGAGLRKLKRGL